MRHHFVRWASVIAVAALATLSGAAVAAAEGLGDPHADGQRGNPHVATATGNPRATAEDPAEPAAEPVVTAEAAQPAAAAAMAEPAVVAAAPAADNGADPPQTGKPADGTVGNADDKSPKGQKANDKNRGYECDDNNGIGKGNPAHSACLPTPPEPPKPPDVPETPETPVTPVIPTQVAGVQFTRGPVAGGALPRTGGIESGLAGAGVLFVLMGATLVAVSRRRAAVD